MNQAVVNLWAALVIAPSDLFDQGRSLAAAAVPGSPWLEHKADAFSSANVFNLATRRIDSVVVLSS
jgi:hypothetical protein